MLDHADPLFLKQVMDGARLLYGSPQRFEQMKLLAFRRYQDHRPCLDMERAYVERVIAAAADDHRSAVGDAKAAAHRRRPTTTPSTTPSCSPCLPMQTARWDSGPYLERINTQVITARA